MKHQSPYNWVIRLLELVCPEHLQEGVIGDLLEQYELNRRRKSKWVSNFLFIWSGVKLLRMGMLRKHDIGQNSNLTAMFFNYLIITIRNARRQSGYYFINFFGLTLGLTFCALVALYVKHELNYDNFHPKADKTYRLVGKHVYSDKWFTSIHTDYFNELAAGKISGVEEALLVSGGPPKLTYVGDKKFQTKNIVRLEEGSELLSFFGFDLIRGNEETAFKEPGSLVLTESTASRFFGDIDPMGKVIKFDTIPLKITGIIQDPPSNTHMDFEMLFTDNHFIFDWAKAGSVYFKTSENTDPGNIIQQAQALSLGLNHYDSMRAFLAEPLQDIHLQSEVVFDRRAHGNTETLYIFVIIAAFILAISCSNYVNLSAAIYSIRNIEIGIRKVLGGSKKSLRQQFLFESIAISLSSLPVVILLVETLLPYYNNFLGIELTNMFVQDFSYFSVLLAIAMASGLIAGIYPALTLSRAGILSLLRKKGMVMVGGLKLRKTLVTLQFTLLMMLGIGAYFVNSQLRFVNNKDIGIEKDGIVKLERAWYLSGAENIVNFKNRLKTNPYILGVSQGSVPGDNDYPSDYQPEGGEVKRNALYTVTDFDYFELLKIQGLAGPYFQETPDEHPNLSLVVNESFVKDQGWTIEEAIGKRIITNPGDSALRYRSIRGVFKDYNFYSLHQKPGPYMIYVRKERATIFQNVLIKVNSEKAQQALSWIEKTWDEFQPDSPLTMEFMDEDLQKAYENDRKTAILSSVLSIAAIMLAVLGLVGLSAYVTELQAKQIGIRKVLGASIQNILFTLNREYVSLVVISNIIAGLVSYLVIDQWLDNFAYRIGLDIYIFPLAGLTVLIITFLTVSYQSLKAARANPVVALRSE